MENGTKGRWTDPPENLVGPPDMATLGKTLCWWRALHLCITQIAIGTPTPRTQPGTLGHFFRTDLSKLVKSLFWRWTVLTIDLSGTKHNCPKPSRQAFRPTYPPPNRQYSNVGHVIDKGSSLYWIRYDCWKIKQRSNTSQDSCMSLSNDTNDRLNQAAKYQRTAK